MGEEGGGGTWIVNGIAQTWCKCANISDTKFEDFCQEFDGDATYGSKHGAQNFNVSSGLLLTCSYILKRGLHDVVLLVKI
jgi:hypothetical protein